MFRLRRQPLIRDAVGEKSDCSLNHHHFTTAAGNGTRTSAAVCPCPRDAENDVAKRRIRSKVAILGTASAAGRSRESVVPHGTGGVPSRALPASAVDLRPSVGSAALDWVVDHVMPSCCRRPAAGGCRAAGVAPEVPVIGPND
jgi:hypothetical protein